ncbi:MAG: amidohydrolase family protein [Nocardioidaceae bacterium]|nr:amidohydrolase family protein [Nocardioidaceae bacterium]
MTLLRHVRPWGGDPVDLELEAGRIAAVGPHQPSREHPGDDIDGRGRIVVPAFTDAHAHLDSSLLGLPFRPHTGGPAIWDMVLNDREHWRDPAWSVTERASYTLGLMVAHGVTRVRTYAQIDVDCRLERFEAVQAAVAEHRDRCDAVVIACPQAGLLREPGVVELMEEALRQGADVVGGIDPSMLDRDPVRHLDVVFGLAERYQVPVDIHLHEPGHLGVWTLGLILERTRALGMQGRVTLAHGYGLGGVDAATTARLVEELAELDVAMSTVAPPQAGTALPLLDLTAAGVRVGLGQDGQRDFWTPYGNGDMLDRTWQLAFTHDFRDDALLEHCLAVATVGGASLLDPLSPRIGAPGSRSGVEVGDPADLLVVDGECVAQVVMDRPRDRTVLKAGVVVADGLVLRNHQPV